MGRLVTLFATEPGLTRRLWLAAVMTVFFLVFETVWLHTPYAGYLTHAFDSGLVWGLARVAGLAALWATQTGFFWLSMQAPPRWRVVYWLLFTSIAVTEYGYVRATGGFMTGHDFRIAFTALEYWPTMIGRYFDWHAAIPALVYAALLATAGRSGDGARQVRRLTAVVGVTLAVHAVYAAAIYARSDEEAGLAVRWAPPAASPQAFFRSATMEAWSLGYRSLVRFQYGGRRQLAQVGTAIPTRNVVLVVDESVRGDHLSINGYARPTTPWLEAEQRAGRVTNWGVVASMTPVSNDSVICLLTGLRQLPDRRHRSTTSPLLFHYARAMNFETHFFDGGARQLRFGLDFGDLEHVDWGTRDRFGNDPDTDFRIAREVAALLGRAIGQFIVVLKRGNHAPYERNYPAATAVWTPDQPALTERGREDAQVVNAYDNALRFNVDRFLQIVAAAQGFDRTVLLYTSDHGQLLTDARSAGLSREVTWGEAAVPLLMMGPSRPPADTGYAASHANITATVLDLLQVPREIRDPGMGRSLLEATKDDRDPRHVFNGAFSGIGSYAIQDFDEMAIAR